MGIAAIGLPTLGNPAFGLRATGVPVVSPLAFFGFGDVVVNPGIDLTSTGMPGCFAYTNLSFGLFAGGPVSAAVSQVTWPLPSSPTLVGASISTQAIALSATTPLGRAASPGAEIVVGYGN
jgi:hypothetical protein